MIMTKKTRTVSCHTHPFFSHLSLVSRVLAAIMGGYLLTSLITLALSLGLPLIGVGRAEAVMASTIISFLIYAAIILAVFHARSAARAWTWLVLAAVPPATIVALTLPRTTP